MTNDDAADRGEPASEQDIVNRWQENFFASTEERLAAVIVGAFISGHTEFDRVSNWLFAATAGIAAAGIANLKEVVSVVTLGGVRWSAACVAVSFLAAMGQKWTAFRTARGLLGLRQAFPAALNVFAMHEKDAEELKRAAMARGLHANSSVDLPKMWRGIRSRLPWFLRWGFRRSSAAQAESVFHSLHLLARPAFAQLAFLTVQAAALVVWLLGLIVYLY